MTAVCRFACKRHLTRGRMSPGSPIQSWASRIAPPPYNTLRHQGFDVRGYEPNMNPGTPRSGIRAGAASLHDR
eukprot:5054497-Amphidinium_carterae.1